ncbi:MAG TPA: glycosyltransferase family 1 protein [Candidatus Aminicenantes bacterium]|nr:glycosyltransferase family 1 protein [Candidatus Aminicenantes bacterium]
MAKATVVHLITKLELGGAQRNTLLTVERLPRYGFSCQIWYGPGGLLTPRAQKLARNRQINQLQRSLRPWKDRAALRQLVELLRQLNPDILHTHSSKAGFLGRLAASRCKVPVVIHSVHGFPFSPLQPLPQQWILMGAEKMAARWTRHYIFVSRADQQTALRLGLCGKNHSLIRSGFELEPFYPHPQRRKEVRRRFQLGDKALAIGVVAPFKPQKNLLQVVEVAKMVCAHEPGAVFFLAGDGALRSRLESAVGRAGLQSSFRMPGFLHDLSTVMDAFDLGLSTALWEGLPQSLVQMRLKQLPVVASRIPGNSEVIRHGENGFLAAPKDTAEYVRHILQLSGNPGLRKRLGQVPEDFSAWDAEHMVQSQAHLYDQLLSNNTRS